MKAHDESKASEALDPAELAAAERLEALLAGAEPDDPTEVSLLDFVARVRTNAASDADAKAGERAVEAFYARLESDVTSDAAPSKQHAGWRSTLRRVSNSPLLRLAAASVLVHLVALPVLAWWVLLPPAEPSYTLRFLPNLEEEAREAELDGESGPALTDAAESATEARSMGPANWMRLHRYELDHRDLPAPVEFDVEDPLEAWLAVRLAGAEAPARAPQLDPEFGVDSDLVAWSLAAELEARLDMYLEADERGGPEIEHCLIAARSTPSSNSAAPALAAAHRRARAYGFDAQYAGADDATTGSPTAASEVSADPRLLLERLRPWLPPERLREEPFATWMAWAQR